MTAAALPAIAALLAQGGKSSRPVMEAVVRSTQHELFYLDENLELCTPDKACIKVTNGAVLFLGGLGVAVYMLYLYRNGFLQWDPLGLHNLNIFGTGGKGGMGYSGGFGLLPDWLVSGTRTLPGMNIIAGLRGMY